MCACIFQGQSATPMLQKKMNKQKQIKIQKGNANAKAKAKAGPVAKTNAKPVPVPKGTLKNVSPKTKAKTNSKQQSTLKNVSPSNSNYKILKKPAASDENPGVDTDFIQMVLHV